MTAPTPAAVRAALEMTATSTSQESHRLIDEMARKRSTRPSVIVALIASNHIRAIAEDLRTQANICEDQEGSYLSPLMLRTFADRLEGKQ